MVVGWFGRPSARSCSRWVGPRIRRIAEAHDLRTVGDFLEWRYDLRVRATVAMLLWMGRSRFSPAS